jgi:hypothetical protein
VMPWAGDDATKPKQADFKAWVDHICSTPRPRHGMTPRPRLRPLNMRLAWQHLSSSATSGRCPRRVLPAALTGFPHSGLFTHAPLTSNGSGQRAISAVGSVTPCRSLAPPRAMHRTMKSILRPKETACFKQYHFGNSASLDGGISPPSQRRAGSSGHSHARRGARIARKWLATSLRPEGGNQRCGMVERFGTHHKPNARQKLAH